MSYIPDPANLTEPTEARPARTAAAEFRALKSTVAALSGGSGVSAITKSPKRQTLLGGAISLAFNGTNTNLNITSTAAALSFASGYDISGPVDSVSLVSGVANDALSGGLIPNCVNYIFADYISPTSVSWGTVAVPPEYTERLPRILITSEPVTGGVGDDFIRDYYGNNIVGFGGASLSTTVSKFGSQSIALAGTTGRITTTGTHPRLDRGSWTVEMWARFTSFPTAGNNFCLFQAATGVTPVVELRIANAAGTIRLALDASSNKGSSMNLANNVLGTKAGASGVTWIANQWYHIALVYDEYNARLYTYVDGVLDSSTACTDRPSTGQLIIGGDVGGTRGMIGFMDDFRLSPGALYGNGTAFTPPTAQLGALGSIYNPVTALHQRFISSSVGAGAAPTMETIKRVYVGEVSVSGAYLAPYAPQGKYSTEVSLASSHISSAIFHAIGVPGREINVSVKAIIDSNISGFSVGDIISVGAGYTQDTSGAARGLNVVFQKGRTTANLLRGPNIGAFREDTGATIDILASAQFQVDFERNW